MLPRAGRRASQAGPSNAIDPLRDVSDVVLPATTSAQNTTSTSGPSWLDDDDAASGAPAAASPSLDVAASSAPLAAADRLLGVAPTTPRLNGTLLGASGYSGHSPASSPAGKSVVPSTMLPTTEPLLPVPHTPPFETMSGLSKSSPSATTVAPSSSKQSAAVYDDDATVMMTLERELAEATYSLEALKESLAALERGSDSESVSLHALDAQIDFMKNQKNAADVSAAAMRDSMAQRKSSLEERSAERLAHIAADVRRRHDDARAIEIRQLEDIAASVQRSIGVLSSDLSAMYQENAVSSPDDFALSKLTAQLRVFISNERSTMKLRARDVLQESTRAIAESANAERLSLVENDRQLRVSAVREHVAAQRSKFDAFRRRAKEERQHAADQLFGALKVRMARFAQEAGEKSSKSLSEYRIKLQADDDRLRQEGNAHHAKMFDGLRGETIAYDQACSKAEADLQQKLLTVSKHTERMHEAERESATKLSKRGLVDCDAAVHWSTVSGLGYRGDEPNTALKLEVERLSREIGVMETFAAHWRGSASCDGPNTEIGRLIHEREEVLRELKKHMEAQKISLKHEWLRLESMLATLASKSDAFEKSARQGRASLTTAQSRLEQVRATWESEARKTLSEAFSGVHALPLSAEGLLTTTLFDISTRLREVLHVSARNAQTRSKLLHQVSSQEELMSHKQDAVSRATMRIVDQFEAIAEANAKIEAKQQWVEREKSDIDVARQSLVAEQTAFQRAVQKAKEVADGLRAASHQASRKANAHHGPASRPGASRKGPPYGDDGDADGSSVSESKYKHLYASARLSRDNPPEHSMSSRTRQGTDALLREGAGDVSYVSAEASFQRLVPVDFTGYSSRLERTDGHDLSIQSHAAQTHRSDRLAAEDAGHYPSRAAAGQIPTSSESGQSAHLGVGRRYSLPTPSSSESRHAMGL